MKAEWRLSSPYSELAGLACQLVANTAEECRYEVCTGEVVGCAVHEATYKEDGKYVTGSAYMPVCAKHKAWEYTKVAPVPEVPWGWPE